MNKKDLLEFKQKREAQKSTLKYERMTNLLKKGIYIGLAALIPMIFGEMGFYVLILGVIVTTIVALAFGDEE